MTEKTGDGMITQAQVQELLTGIELIKQNVGWIREDAKMAREAVLLLQSRVHTIEIERVQERSEAKGRHDMAKWVWGCAVAASGSVGSVLTLALNAWVKLGAPHP